MAKKKYNNTPRKKAVEKTNTTPAEANNPSDNNGDGASKAEGNVNNTPQGSSNEPIETPVEETKTVADKHKEFRDSAIPKTSPSNEPVLETDVNKTETAFHPFQAPTKERDYTKLGYEGKTTTSSSNTNKTAEPSTEPGTSSGSSFDPPPPPNDEFSAEPPPMDDPNYAQEPSMEPGEGGSTFNMPTGSAEEVIDFGAKTLNALIGNFGGLLVGIKIKPEYYSIKDNRERAADIIKEHNVQSVERLKFDSEDISMLKPPLVKMMKEKGIRGLTTGEELMIAVIVVVSKKVKVVSEIRGMNKKLETRFSAMVASMQPAEKTQEPQPAKEEIIEEVEAEEVN